MTKKSLIALALGTLALGIAELVMMGILLFLSVVMFAGAALSVAATGYGMLLCAFHFRTATVSALMVAAGFGMVAGNLCGGRMADKYGPGRVIAVTQTVTVAVLLLTFLFSGCGWLSALLMVVCAGTLFAVSSPLQYLILRHAPGGEMLGGACIQVAFNFGNAMGALIGGLPIAAGMAYSYPALCGVPCVVCGLVCTLLFHSRYEHRRQ